MNEMEPAQLKDVLFSHVVGDVDECFDQRRPFEFDAPPSAQIRMSIDPDEGFWLTANSDGFLHLARVFAEMGLRKLEDGHHFHQGVDFRGSAGPPEFSFELDNTAPAPLPEISR